MFFEKIQSKVQDRTQVAETIAYWKAQGERIVFTNGCFDILHFGHIHYLAAARDLGHRLIVGVNSDASVRRLKGPTRPIQDQLTRLHLLASLAFVDAVVLFEEDSPYDLIAAIRPQVLVKGGDWQPSQIVGADLVFAEGGEVRSLPFVDGSSTSLIEAKILGK